MSEERVPVIPWYLWCSALAVTSAYVGGYWDISWHRSIGRDTFWSAPHMAIYACGVLAGISSAYLIFTTTFGGTIRAARRQRPHLGPARAAGRVHRGLGRRGDAGVGALRRLVAQRLRARREDHQPAAHGAGRRVLRHRARHGHADAGVHEPRVRRGRAATLQWLFLYVGGTAVSESLLLKMEYISRSDQHSALFYIVVAIGTPGVLIAIAVASRHRWACTIMAGVYSAFALAFLWMLPLFPAEPKLGPVYRPVTHFIPWEFPLLLIVPAVGRRSDASAHRKHGGRSSRGLMAGIAFFVVVHRRAVAVREVPDDAVCAQLVLRHRRTWTTARRPQSMYARNIVLSRTRRRRRSSGAAC